MRHLLRKIMLKIMIIVGITVAVIVLLLVIQSWRYEHFKSVCLAMDPGIDLAKAREILEGAGAKHVALINNEHQWLRVRFSPKHQSCMVAVDAKDKVLGTRHVDSWDLL